MKIEFEYFKNPLPFNDETMNMLKKRGTYFFCHIKETDKEYNYNKWRYDTIEKEKVITIEMHPNIIVIGHDFFSPSRYKNCVMLGICKLKFPENLSISI